MKSKKLTVFIFFLIGLLLFSSCADDPAIKDPPPSVSSQSSVTVPESSGDNKTDTQNIAGSLKISYLNVGQGDSTFIVLPNGETVLIDAGEQVNSGGIIKTIQDSGKDTLDYVIVTHPHTDHMGGMAAVINSFTVKNIYMPRVSHTTIAFENLLDTIESCGLTIQTAKKGKVVFDFGNLKAEFLAPGKDSYSGLNNYSAVLMLSYNDKNFLFMGDAEKEVETEILSSGYNVSADILKVGHHGSSSSSSDSFIKAVKPSIAVISVGKNSYGHPTAATLATLTKYKADIWRTDEKGTVIVTYDGAKITINNIAITTQPNAPPDTTQDDPAITEPQGMIVYVTNTGKKYHMDGCRYLSSSKIAVSLAELDTYKYSPCAVCNPPAK